jgi:hypothetical protein
MSSAMYNFLFDQLFAAGLRLKYALTTEDDFDFAKAALIGQTLFVGEGNLSFALCFAEQLDKFTRKTICASTFERREEWLDTTRVHAKKLVRLGCEVMDGMDAQKIDTLFGGPSLILSFFSFQTLEAGSQSTGEIRTIFF